MNKAILVGNIGSDPEMKYSQSGSGRCTFTLATNDGWGDNKKTNWHRVVIFGKSAEAAGRYLKKGSSVGIVGRIDYNKVQRDDGYATIYTSIIADSWEFVGNKSEGGGRPPKTSKSDPQPPAGSDDDWADDDVPF